MERFNLKKLNEIEIKEQCQVENSNRFAALENLNDVVDVDRSRETIREDVRISTKETNKNIVWHVVNLSSANILAVISPTERY
jgi:hypothetical protein